MPTPPNHYPPTHISPANASSLQMKPRKTNASSYLPLVLVVSLIAYLWFMKDVAAGGVTKLSSTAFRTHRHDKQCPFRSIAAYLEKLPKTQHLIGDSIEMADRIQAEFRQSLDVPTAVLFLSDSKYEMRFDEMINTWAHFVGSEGNLIMAAIDEATHVYFQKRGIKSVRVFPGHLAAEQSVREAVLRAKVEVPYVFLLRGLRVVMVEMDIYCRANPLRLDNGKVDILVSEHNYCEEVNVGFWVAHPTCPAIESFRRMRAWAINPNRTHAYCDGAFDQKLMHYAWLGSGPLSAGSHTACAAFAQRDQVFDPRTDEPVALDRIRFEDIMHWTSPPDPETWPLNNGTGPICVHLWSGFGPPTAQMRYGYRRRWFPPSSERQAEVALGRLDINPKDM